MFKIQNLSKKYLIKKLIPKDVPILLELADGNPYYYKTVPPAPSKESFLKDMKALPPKMKSKDKFYIGFYKENELDCNFGFNFKLSKFAYSFYWLFYASHKKYQCQGLGSQIIQEILLNLPPQYTEVRLGVPKTNEISQKFWQKNGFELTGEKYRQPLYTVLMMNRKLG